MEKAGKYNEVLALQCAEVQTRKQSNPKQTLAQRPRTQLSAKFRLHQHWLRPRPPRNRQHPRFREHVPGELRDYPRPGSQPGPAAHARK